MGEHDGKEVECFQIKNGNLVLTLSSYGATILSCKHNGEEVTLCWQDLENLKDRDKNPYYGATCGRVAGRIEKATFKLNNDIYDLEANNGQNSLHGGIKGWDRHNWKAKQTSKMMQIGTKTEIQLLNGVEFKRTSPHDEEGFPCEI